MAKATGPARDWIFGVVNFGKWLVEPEGAYQPLTIFWLTPDGRPLFLEPVGPHQLREKAVESFYRVAEDNKEFGLPARVRVRVSELHHALAAGLPPEIDVMLTSTPEADVFIEKFSQMVADRPEKLTKLTRVADVPDFYQSAAQVLRLQPWLWLSEQDVLTVSAPECGIPWAGLVASPDYIGESPGLLLFSSRYDAEVYPRKKRDKKWSLERVPYHVVLTFRDLSKVGSDALKEMADRGWDASNGLAPVVVAYGPNPEPREATLAEQGALSAIQFAFASAFMDPDLDVERGAVANLFTVRLRVRMPQSPIISSVDFSAPINALDRLRAAADKVSRFN